MAPPYSAPGSTRLGYEFRRTKLCHENQVPHASPGHNSSHAREAQGNELHRIAVFAARRERRTRSAYSAARRRFPATPRAGQIRYPGRENGSPSIASRAGLIAEPRGTKSLHNDSPRPKLQPASDMRCRCHRFWTVRESHTLRYIRVRFAPLRQKVRVEDWETRRCLNGIYSRSKRITPQHMERWCALTRRLEADVRARRFRTRQKQSAAALAGSRTFPAIADKQFRRGLVAAIVVC